jgi:hypothetical protein
MCTRRCRHLFGWYQAARDRGATLVAALIVGIGIPIPFPTLFGLGSLAQTVGISIQDWYEEGSQWPHTRVLGG